MDVTLAWIKGKRTNGLRRLINGNAAFEMPEINKTAQYDSDLKLETYEWFCLENFTDSEYAIDVIKKMRQHYLLLH